MARFKYLFTLTKSHYILVYIDIYIVTESAESRSLCIALFRNLALYMEGHSSGFTNTMNIFISLLKLILISKQFIEETINKIMY